MIKRSFLVLTLMLMLLATAVPALAGTPAVLVDGTPITLDVPPIVNNGTAMVPLRAVFEKLGFVINWNDEQQLVTATKDNTVIKLYIGGKAYKNEMEINLESPPIVVNYRTLIPMNFLSDAVDYAVELNEDSISVTSPDQAPTPPAQQAEPSTPVTTEPADQLSPSVDQTESDKPAAATPFEEYLNTLPYDTTVIANVDKEAQFVITGDNAGNYVIVIKNGTVSWYKGSSSNPAITVRTSESIWLKAASREIDPTSAIMDGLILTDGDLPFFVEIKDSFIKTAN
ncbi:SCP-2 sterol transfer family protein [Desulfotomaculum arcticum]|uniref:SCP-2 sterol transfer family protein n=1 Tax=Desulfotruncus arcticus DSM 17038 TaxID=1121424 RepID=A0A1I2WYL0_9FIRM|nr:stalk domain-containing protein [Desulfotruncus arcticus]SFH06424.1 SCP-2 sterol transfer family protein [Desulfotomaculum arcticum] [Desulfotruncus arcticus DSM 17038]